MFGMLLALGAAAAPPQPGRNALVQRHWFEARTAHFVIYSCGATQEVARLGVRLEQFHDAWSLLAGTQSVASPPIVVMAFPDVATMRPFLPLYQGQPANLAALFSRGSDQNLIVLTLSGSDDSALKIVFHEYTHLLLRHNQPYWPMWLTEGMAEIYATFEVVGGSRARVGQPIDSYLQLLTHTPLMPLYELFAVTRDSPQYNERQRQGIFYSESWLLTDYLMLGGNAAHKAAFRQLTPLLRQGQSPEQAFTNAFRTSLPAMQAQLRHYLEAGKFAPLELALSANVNTARRFATRILSPMEVCYRLGDELLHVGRLDTAESYFLQARKLAPASPLAYEGLGLLAARRGNSEEAVRYLAQAMKLGPLNFTAHYIYAREKYLLSVKDDDHQRPDKATAAVIRSELQKSLALMPDFSPAHHLLGFIEMAEGDDLASAEKHVARAIQLEPENQAYLLTLAQVQVAKKDPSAARRTLEPLRLPYVEPQIRAHAVEMLKSIPQ
jgi:Flp pilus assembly protein TadD